MEWYEIAIIIFIGITVFFFTFVSPFIVGYILYIIHMVRTKPTKWQRECSLPDDKIQSEMYNQGLEYISKYKDKIKEVSITSSDLHLYGEYVDIGANRCVILLGGRCECLYYAYYYAKPYLENNCNVLVIDQRAHGNSEGTINTVGFNESNDVLDWARLLHYKYGMDEIYIHGTCIGGATGVHLLAKNDVPKYITKLICDSLYSTYYETFKNHVIYLKKPVWPSTQLSFFWYKLYAKIDARKVGPITLIDKVKVPILLITSEEDEYVRKWETKALTNKLVNKDSKSVYLPKGTHSRVRYEQVEDYDKLIIDFIGK